MESRNPRVTQWGSVALTTRHSLPTEMETSPTSGGRSVSIIRLRTKATEFSFCRSLCSSTYQGFEQETGNAIWSRKHKSWSSQCVSISLHSYSKVWEESSHLITSHTRSRWKRLIDDAMGAGQHHFCLAFESPDQDTDYHDVFVVFLSLSLKVLG
jgi:hypothetical protein